MSYSRAVAVLLASLFPLLVPAGAWGVPMLVLDIAGQGDSAEIPEGQLEFAVSVLAVEIPAGSDGSGMFGFGFSLFYDEAQLEVLDVAVNTSVWTGFSTVQTESGGVFASANRFGQTSGPTGSDILLAEITFGVAGPAATSLDLGAFGDPDDNILFDGFLLDGLSGFFTSGEITASGPPDGGLAIPEPASLALFAAGWLVLGGVFRRQA